MDKASRETVDLDGLAIKIFGKYMKFLQGKVLDRQQRGNDPKSPAATGKPNVPEPNPGDDLHSTTVQSVHMSEFPIESSAQMQNAKDLVKKA